MEMETYKLFGEGKDSLITMTLGNLLNRVAEVYPDNEAVLLMKSVRLHLRRIIALE